jgi:succinyl-diaminopimelate desuccinylase
MRTHLDSWVESHVPQLIETTQAVLRIPSVQDDATADRATNAPFGQAIADALAYTLSVCEANGFQTENFAGYVGHADFGTGTEIAAMLGHLDVVRSAKAGNTIPGVRRLADGWIWGARQHGR